MICGMLATTSCSDYLDKESDTELDLNLVFEDKTRTEGCSPMSTRQYPIPIWTICSMRDGRYWATT